MNRSPSTDPVSALGSGRVFLMSPAAWACGLILLAGGLAYANSFAGQFVVDDGGAIQENPSIRRLWPLGPVLWGATHATVIGRPLLNLSLALDFAWGGLDPKGYHAVNLALHVIAGLLLFDVIRRTLLLSRIPDQLSRSATFLAFSITLIWTVHPLQTESVTYVVQRAEVLAGLFYLGTLCCVIHGAAGSHAGIWYGAAIALCFLGMASKEVMVSAPLVVFLYDRIFLCDSFREVMRRRWPLHIGLATSWAWLALLMSSSAGRSQTAGFGYGMSSWDYAVTQFGAIVGYLGRSFWPAPLILDYGRYIARTPAEIVPYLLIVLSLLCATLWALRYRPRLGFLGLCFFAILAPSSSIVPLVTQTMADHRMYLPLASIVILAVLAAWTAWQSLLGHLPGSKSSRAAWLKGIPMIVVLGLALGLGYGTFRRNEDYHSVLGIWRDNARKWPRNEKAFWTIGLHLIRAGDLDGAIASCTEALRINPRSFQGHLNRGIAFAKRGEYPQALEDYARAIELDPKLYISYHDRGNVFALMERNAEAIADFSRAIELKPSHVASYLELGSTWKRLGRYDDAIADFTAAIRLQPVQPAAYNLRGHCRKLQGRLPEAIEDYTRALDQKPDFPDALNNRGSAYGEAGYPDRAIADFTKIIEQLPGDPNYIAVYKNRAICYFDLKQFDRAWSDLLKFEDLGGQPNPEFVKVLNEARKELP